MKSLILLMAGLCFAFSLRAQSKTDTTKKLKEVTITAKTPAIEVRSDRTILTWPPA